MLRTKIIIFILFCLSVCIYFSPYRRPGMVDVFLSLSQRKTEAKTVLKTCFKT